MSGVDGGGPGPLTRPGRPVVELHGRLPTANTRGDDSRKDGGLVRLQRMLGAPETAWLLARLRSRLESTGDLTGTVSKTVASAAERSAVARLLGKPVRAGRSATVPLEVLDNMLRRSGAWPQGLASAVVELTGPVIDPADRAAEREEWWRANETLRALAEERPAVAVWAQQVVRSGGLRRASTAAGAAQLLADRLSSLAAALPSTGESLGVFSARVLGDAHALDAQSTLGSLAAGMAASLGGCESDATAGSARWRRDAWQCVGVVVDELSSTVLALGLPGGGKSPTARALDALAGQPVVLTLRQLMSDAVGDCPRVVYVCENPAVVAAAADRLGDGSAPLVCVNGQPGAAVLTLLQALSSGGSELRYHGDFDWGGAAIARTLARRALWQPWRFGAADYLAACAGASQLPELHGNAGETPWDPALATAMESAGLKVEEELVLADLLADLVR